MVDISISEAPQQYRSFFEKADKGSLGNRNGVVDKSVEFAQSVSFYCMENPRSCVKIAEYLGKKGYYKSDVASSMLKLFYHDDLYVKRGAQGIASYLYKSDQVSMAAKERAVSSLIENYSNTNNKVLMRVDAGNILLRFAQSPISMEVKESILDAYIANLDDKVDSVRNNACLCLSWYADDMSPLPEQFKKKLIPALVKATKDSVYLISMLAVDNLGGVVESQIPSDKRPVVKDAIFTGAEHKWRPVRKAAIESLAKIVLSDYDHKSKVEAMKKITQMLLHDSNPDVRRKAAKTLGMLTRSSVSQEIQEIAVEPLTQALKDPDSHVQSSAKRSLRRFKSN